MSIENFNKPERLEGGDGLLDKLKEAKSIREISAAIRALYPGDAIEQITKKYDEKLKANKELSEADITPALQEEVKRELDTFTEKVFDAGKDNPKKILIAYNFIGGTTEHGHEYRISNRDAENFKEKYRSAALGAIKSQLEQGVEEHIVLKNLYDLDRGLLSEMENDSQWRGEVRKLLGI